MDERRQVAEDGPGACNSDSDSDKTDSNGNPISCEHRISNEQAEALGRASQPLATSPMESASGKESDGG
jgi:hypothetical protein